MASKPDQTRPNIIFFIADDHRYSALSSVGTENVATPNLDKLAEQGTSFTRSYMMGSDNVAVCMPSRGMLMTGKDLFAANLPDLEGQALWPEQLRAAGYTTYGVGKWHNEPASYSRCFEGGDAIFFGGMSDHDKVPLWNFRPEGDYPEAPDRIGDGFSTTLFADAAIDFLETHDDEHPFCLYVAFTAPHDPRTPPAEYAALYDPEQVELPENVVTEHPFDNGEMNVRDELLVEGPRTPDIVRRHLADYYGMITHLDAEIGRILTCLDKKGLSENTVVIYTADHGLAVGQHGLLGKQNLYDHSVRVPLTLRGPGIPAGQQRDDLCYMPDLNPTLLGLTRTGTAQGVFRNLLADPSERPATRRDSIFAAYKDVQRMVRRERYKLIVYRVDGAERLQLFDLWRDPGETQNLASLEPYADVLEDLKQELKSWQIELGDPHPYV